MDAVALTDTSAQRRHEDAYSCIPAALLHTAAVAPLHERATARNVHPRSIRTLSTFDGLTGPANMRPGRNEE
jgi:hypothetical protein